MSCWGEHEGPDRPLLEQLERRLLLDGKGEMLPILGPAEPGIPTADEAERTPSELARAVEGATSSVPLASDTIERIHVEYTQGGVSRIADISGGGSTVIVADKGTQIDVWIHANTTLSPPYEYTYYDTGNSGTVAPCFSVTNWSTILAIQNAIGHHRGPGR